MAKESGLGRTASILLFLMALFAFSWIVHRAIVQSITLDEADTFLHWVNLAEPTHWLPNANNHVLNSTLMRLSVWLFGLSHLAVRAPAVLGGLLYIFSMYRFCALFIRNGVLACALFLCLVYNPFIMDYLVAARGYGLALGFLSLAIYTLMTLVFRAPAQITEHQAIMSAALISVCVGLCVCSNFSFSIVVAVLALITGALLFPWMRRERKPLLTWVRVSASLMAPAPLIVLVLAGSALTEFPRDHLIWGTTSLQEMWREIRSASFTELNPYLVNPLLSRLLLQAAYPILRSVAGSSIAYLVLILATRSPWQHSDRSRILAAGVLSSVFVMALTGHWIQFKLLGILLPLERTSIWIVPLVTAAVGLMLSVAPLSRAQRAFRTVAIGSLLMLGFYFVGELRDKFFRLWRSGADVQAAFPIVQNLCRQRNVTSVASDFNFTSGFKVYKIFYQAAEPDFLNFDKMPSDKIIYVLEESQFGDFIRTEKLEIAWRGSHSDLVVLVRPEKPY